ncbi:MAG: nitrate reductase molybdenum cofactor assembly chaperone [Actinomycetes bacterium]
MRSAGAAVVLQSVAVLLSYPDEGRRATWPTVRVAAEGLPPGIPRERLGAFLDTADSRDPRELAEHYVAVFDRRRRCCPYLTWWTDGETRRRGASLAALKQRYRAAGVEPVEGELPDYLPLVCEYAATADLADGLALLQEHRPGVELLRLALADAQTPYVLLLEALCALLPGPSPQDRAAAQRLARSGPPVEQVGLEPFPVPSAAPSAPVPGGRR